MSAQALKALYRDVDNVYVGDISPAQLHQWMLDKKYGKVAAQLVPFVLSSHVLGRVHATFGDKTVPYDDQVAQALFIMANLLPKWQEGGLSVMNWVATYTVRGLQRYIIQEQQAWQPSLDEDLGQGFTLADKFASDLGGMDMLDSADEYSKLDFGRANLTIKQEHAVRMYYLYDLNYREIGEILGCTRQASQQFVKAGLTKLGRSL